MCRTPLHLSCLLLSIAPIFSASSAENQTADDNYCFEPTFESKVHWHTNNAEFDNILKPKAEGGEYDQWKPHLLWEMKQFSERELPPIYDIVASEEEICAGDLIHYIIWDSSGGSKATQSAWCEARIGVSGNRKLKGIRGFSEDTEPEPDPFDAFVSGAVPGEDIDEWGDIRQKGNLIVKFADGRTYEDPKAIMPTRKWNSGYGMPTSTSKTLVLDSGEYVGYTGWFTGTCYGHFLTDQLPSIAYLRSQRPNAKLILMDTPMSRNIIEFIDPLLYETIVWTQKNQHVMIRGGTLSIYKPDHLPTVMGRNLFRYFWDWMKEARPEVVPPERQLIVYYTRHNPIVTGGRQIERTLELQIIELIKLKMVHHGRKERLYIYNGNDGNGDMLSVNAQFHIFRSATTAIGPHGTGLVNAIWMKPFPETCAERPQMLEFTPGPDSIDVHSALFNGHYTTLGRGFPMLDYNTVTYTAESTKDVVYVSLDDVALALDRMWGKPEDDRSDAVSGEPADDRSDAVPDKPSDDRSDAAPEVAKEE